MAVAQLNDLQAQFSNLSTDVQPLATWLDEGGLVQLSQGLSHELEKKGAPPAQVPGSVERYMVAQIHERLEAANQIYGFLVSTEGASKADTLKLDELGLVNFVRFIAGMGYPLSRVREFADEELLELLQLYREQQDKFKALDAEFLEGLLHSVVDSDMDRKMRDEVKLRRSFRPGLAQHLADITTRINQAAKELNDPGLSNMTQANRLMFSMFIAGQGYSWEDFSGFSAIDIAALSGTMITIPKYSITTTGFLHGLMCS